jgi:hypothetical protein
LRCPGGCVARAAAARGCRQRRFDNRQRVVVVVMVTVTVAVTVTVIAVMMIT